MLGLDIERVANGWVLVDHSDNSRKFVFNTRDELMVWVGGRVIQVETPA